eukprot:1161446-Pelagomonas_calceolata.AAC.12
MLIPQFQEILLLDFPPIAPSIKEKGHPGYEHFNNHLTTTRAQSRDLLLLRGSQGGTVCLTLQNPQSPAPSCFMQAAHVVCIFVPWPSPHSFPPREEKGPFSQMAPSLPAIHHASGWSF